MKLDSALTSGSCTYGFEKIDLSKQGHLDLLLRAHDEIYVPSFPIEEERDSLELWLMRLSENTSKAAYRYAIFIAGDQLENPQKAILKGISVGIYYKEAQAGLMAYNAIAPIARGNGLGRLMVELRRLEFEQMAQEAEQDLRAIYVEINDPDKIGAELDIYDPRKRERLFKSWGAIHIPIDYVQKNGFDGLKLMFYPDPNRPAPTFRDVEKFIKAMHPGNEKEPLQRTLRSLFSLAANSGVKDPLMWEKTPVVEWPVPRFF